jgi:hypothetical protein
MRDFRGGFRWLAMRAGKPSGIGQTARTHPAHNYVTGPNSPPTECVAVLQRLPNRSPGSTMTLALRTFPRQIAYACSLAATVAFGIAAFPQLSNAAGLGSDQSTAHVMKVAAHKSVDVRIDNLHQRLHITPAQESLWHPVAQVMRDNADTMESLRKTRSDRATDMSAMDNLHSYGEVADAHAEGVKKLTTAFQPLYDSMSDTQKRNADTIFRDSGHHAIRKE